MARGILAFALQFGGMCLAVMSGANLVAILFLEQGMEPGQTPRWAWNRALLDNSAGLVVGAVLALRAGWLADLWLPRERSIGGSGRATGQAILSAVGLLAVAHVLGSALAPLFFGPDVGPDWDETFMGEWERAQRHMHALQFVSGLFMALVGARWNRRHRPEPSEARST